VSIADAETIDAAGIDVATDYVVLTIADDLDWQDEPAHFLALQHKINAYLQFIESGRLVETMPLAQDKKVQIAVYQQFDPPPSALGALEDIGNFLHSRVIRFSYGVPPKA
jgi:hypothetical protein